MKAIVIQNLHKVFRDKKLRRVEALTGLNLEIEQGEVFGFLGPNGAGKSTTIKLVMGLLRATSGDIRIMNIDAVKPEARRQVGFLPENPAFYDYLSGEEYLGFVGRSFGLEAASVDLRIEEVLSRLDLQESRKRPLRTFSKGMVQRLGIAQTMVHDPDLYILDEPMSGLDPIGRALVKEIILDLKAKGKTVFFSTHITSDVESICERVAILNKGILQSVERVESLMLSSVHGYRVLLREATGSIYEKLVEKDQLSSFLATAGDVVLVEPCRKSLEQVFLDLVSEDGTR